MPSDQMYIPVQAGAALHNRIEAYRQDDEDDGGISLLNPHLSELTVLYWAWKNLDADVIGLTHYRRYFAGSGERGILTFNEAQQLMQKTPIVVARRRNYIIETVGDHYAHTFERSHLELLSQTLENISSESLPALEYLLSDTRAHMFNMVIMRRDFLDQYASWLFPIVLELEQRFNYADVTPFVARAPGRLAEFLLDTWLETYDAPYQERKIRELEPIKWANKGASFLAAKFLNKKYSKSF